MCKCITEVLNTCPGTGLKKSLTYEPLYDEEGNKKQFENGAVPTNPAFNESWGNYLRFGTPIEERVFECKDYKFVQQVMYQYLE